ncbi:MAG: DUF2884 family protein [Dokdonella sp.]
MNKFQSLTLGVLTSLPLLACSQPPAPPAPPAAPAPPTAGNETPTTMIGRHVDKAISEARAELRTKNISVSDGINININGHQIHRSDSGLPKAEITPKGDLLIEGKAVKVNASQRQQLLAYRQEILGVADAGMAIGVKGADIAGEALGGVVGAIFGGKDGEKAFEQRMEAQGKKIEAEAMKLCTRLPALLASQQALSASMPEFKPYARMTQEDIDDCGKDDKPNVAVTSH